ncbi:MAG: ABC transporter permease [Acidobacteria bacterium]|nr:ABC transporter permease [Acidobacteriota bacterium]MBV9436779.1 ABC transporter permease [Acidobacteriota bacterium]
MSTLKSDIQFGARMLRKDRAFTAIAVLTLALGIGANTAIFSIVNCLLFRPLPAPQPEQITELAFRQHGGNVANQFSTPDYRVIRSQTGNVFSSLGAYQVGLDGLSTNGKADRLMTYYVSGNFFSMLSIQPAQGRLLQGNEGETVDADPVIVLSYSYWQKRFAGDPSVVGQKVSVNGHPLTVVGIAPKGFYGPYPILEAQAYLPLGMNTIEGTPRDFLENRGLRQLVLLGRLRDGVTLENARASLAVVGRHLATDFPEFDKDLELQAYPEVRSRPQPDPTNAIAIVSGLFLGLAGMVLLLACMNVANILLVRATVREREIAIRAALGASRHQLIQQLLTESILLALVGGFAGMLLGYASSAVLSSLNLQTDLPVHLDFGFDWRVFAYSFVAALVTGIVVGLVPALRSSRGNLNAVLHQSGRGVVGGRARFRAALVAIQVGGSLILLIVAGLFTRSLQAAQRTNLGFDANHVVNFYMDPTEIGYSPQQAQEFYKQLLARITQLPGVETVATASSAPMGYYGNGDGLIIDGYQPPAGQPGPGAQFELISGDYFNTMKIPLVTGRAFRDSENESASAVAIVNEAMAKKYWPNQDPVGRHFRRATEPKRPIEIVGVAKDARYNLGSGPVNSNFYLPTSQHPALGALACLQVRTTGDPAAMIPEIERTVHSLAADLPVFDVQTMTQALYTLNGLLMYQLGAGLAAAMGLLGLILSIVGVYGIISYSVSQRTQEIGIRMALGAQPGSILSLVLRQGVWIVSAGLVFGIACALGCAKLVGKFLVVSGSDPLTYGTVSAALACVALLACYVPARRGTKVNPIVALRHE